MRKTVPLTTVVSLCLSLVVYPAFAHASLSDKAIQAFIEVQSQSAGLPVMLGLIGLVVILLGAVICPIIKFGYKIITTGILLSAAGGLIYIIFNHLGPKLLQIN